MGRKRKPDARIQQRIGGEIHRVTVYMDIETKTKLQAVANREGKTYSLVISEALDKHLWPERRA